jgi:hypothetical protein
MDARHNGQVSPVYRANPHSLDEVVDAPSSPSKLDLRYFTDPKFCPAMVRRQARRGFELFVFLARRSLEASGEPVSPTHNQLCRACGLDPGAGHARVTISRLLGELRLRYGVIAYEPVRRRRPRIRLLPPAPDTDLLQPKHYIYLGDIWGSTVRERFDVLGANAFAAEYMYLVAAYESALARTKHGRAYWFYPLEKIAKSFHVSPRFAGSGLRSLVELGVMTVNYGQFGIQASQDEFGRANRYYFQGFGELARRKYALERLEIEYEVEFPQALEWSAALVNGATAKNTAGLCDLIRRCGCDKVAAIIECLRGLPRRSLKRRLGYVQAVLEAKK